jgi:hypothetical protein
MTALDTLVELRKIYPTPMSNSQLGELLNAVAWKHQAEGYGLLAKPIGANCLQPQTGTLVARDILASTAGKHFDVLVDAEGAAKPVWQDKGAYQPSRFVSPVDSTIPLPPTPPPPPPLPPTSPSLTQPYPDEATWWTTLFEEIDRLYGLANHPRDLGTFKWSVRTAYDIGAGMDKEKAKVKHLAELRAALGLGRST